MAVNVRIPVERTKCKMNIASLSKSILNFNLNFIPQRKGIYLVGGSVRDAMLGYVPKDHDLAVTGDACGVAGEIAEMAGTRVIRMGKAGQTIYRVIAGGHTFDIASAKDVPVEKDLALRDFTINAMAFDVFRKTIIDPLNGISDLAAGRVRAVRPEAFADDPLRLLRAFRIAATLDFDVCPETLCEIRKNACRIKKVAGERIREEWFGLLDAKTSIDQIQKLDASGLIAPLFPEMERLKSCRQNYRHTFTVWDHTLVAYRHLENLLERNTPPLSDRYGNRGLVCNAGGKALLKHAALLHDVGKPEVQSIGRKGGIHFYGHETAGARISLDISDRLRVSSRWKNDLHAILKHHLRPLFLFVAVSQQRPKPIAHIRFFRKTAPLTPDLLLLFTADQAGKTSTGPDLSAVEFSRATTAVYLDSFCPKLQASPLIRGDELIRRFGLPPSPAVAEVLETIETQRLAGNLATREEALIFAENYIRSKNLS